MKRAFFRLCPLLTINVIILILLRCEAFFHVYRLRHLEVCYPFNAFSIHPQTIEG